MWLHEQLYRPQQRSEDNITPEACINVFKTMILSLLEYGDVIFAGTSVSNLSSIDRLFFRGLRICLNFNFTLSKEDICNECHIST